MKLDSYQQTFVDFPIKPKSVLILSAVAGSGKSTSIVHKIHKMIEDGSNPREFVVTTFSNKSASDIRRKLKKNGNTGVMVGTTHKIMIDLYKKYTGSSPAILTEWESVLLVRDILSDIGMHFHTKKEASAVSRVVINYIQMFQSNYLSEDIHNFKLSDSPLVQDPVISDQQFVDVYIRYHDTKVGRSVFDFNDLLSDRLIQHLDLEDIRKSVKYIFVDECQDYDRLIQQCITTVFIGASMVYVGDIAQVLYSFRWAYTDPMTDPNVWYKLGYESVDTLYLLNNYRSDGNIVKVCNAYRKHMDGVQTNSMLPETKGSVFMTTLNTEVGVGSFIAKEIRSLLQDGVSPRDITVLVRKSGFIKTVIEPAFTQYDVPYKVSTPQYKKKFYEVPINKMYLSLIDVYLTKDVNRVVPVLDQFVGVGITYRDNSLRSGVIPDDDKGRMIKDALKPILNFTPPGGRDDIVSLVSLCTDVVLSVVKHSVWTDKQMAVIVKTLSNFATLLIDDEGVEELDDLLYNILQRIHEYDQEFSDAVEVTTVHQYKGMENRVVFVSNINDVSYSIDESTYPVMYVALSRAIDKLYIVDAEHINTYSMGTVKAKPYPLIDKMKGELFK